MRKEVIFAILAGILIGLIFAVGTWKITKTIKKNVPVVEKKVTPKPNDNLLITIQNLENFDVLTENPVIKGLTKPNSQIIILTQDKDYQTKSTDDGSFEKEVELPAGLSEIAVTVFDQNENSNRIKLILVYSTEFSKYLISDKRPISYVGTITDITGATIQLRGNSEGILQISTGDDTSYINTLKKNIQVKLTDLAIGDYIVALGFMNGNKVLNTKRILITSPLTENKIEVKKIIIEKLTKTTINDIVMPKKWVGPNIKDLEVGQTVFITGTNNENKFDIRSIFVIE